jgi:hypothetical protein
VPKIQNIERICQLLLLLGSDKPGEVVAAGGALLRTLKAEGADLHDLVAHLRGKERLVFVDQNANSAQAIARSCLQLDTSRLAPRQRKFIAEMAARLGDPSERQWSWLRALHDRLIHTQNNRAA